jgi:hypothetical protein
MKIIKFVLNNVVLKIDERNLTIHQIESTKQLLSYVCNCTPDDIDVIFEENNYSDYDVSNKGIFNWKDLYPNYIKGVGLSVKLGSDEHLDSILDNTIEKYLIFI